MARTGGDKATTLKPIALSEDGSLVLATRANAKTGAFRVRVDDVLLELIRAAQERAAAEVQAAAAEGNGTALDEIAEPSVPRADSQLSPKEIQALLRQGRSVTSIAKKAGVGIEWIQRFEGPIAWERAGMATRAQRATLVRVRRGASKLPLGEAVATNLRMRAPRTNGYGNERWDAVRHARRKTWIVTCSFSTRGRPASVRWEFDPETDEITALSKLAGDLGFVARRKRRT
ncbi:MAG: septation protein SepH [Actinomycetota bacterium]